MMDHLVVKLMLLSLSCQMYSAVRKFSVGECRLVLKENI